MCSNFKWLNLSVVAQKAWATMNACILHWIIRIQVENYCAVLLCYDSVTARAVDTIESYYKLFDST